MAALKDIKRKIKGIQKTKQITKAMNMVATAKFKTAYQRMENFRAYTAELTRILDNLSGRVPLESHPLLAVRGPVKTRLVIISSDRGLCGSFNTNLFKFADRFIKGQVNDGKEVIISPIGRKGRDFYRRRSVMQGEMADLLGRFDMSLVASIADSWIDSFIRGEFDELYLIYNRFISPAVQRPEAKRLLPLGIVTGQPGEIREDNRYPDYIYEPRPEVLLERLFPLYIHSHLYQVLVETETGENGARMVAMDNATKNCDELNRSLTLKYNKARQAAITAELMDIVGGAEALSKA